MKRDSTFDGQFTGKREYFGHCVDLKRFWNPFFSNTRTRISSKPPPPPQPSSFNSFFNRTSKRPSPDGNRSVFHVDVVFAIAMGGVPWTVLSEILVISMGEKRNLRSAAREKLLFSRYDRRLRTVRTKLTRYDFLGLPNSVYDRIIVNTGGNGPQSRMHFTRPVSVRPCVREIYNVHSWKIACFLSYTHVYNN